MRFNKKAIFLAAIAACAAGAVTVSAALWDTGGDTAQTGGTAEGANGTAAPAAAADAAGVQTAADASEEEAVSLEVDIAAKAVTVRVNLPEKGNSALSVVCMDPAYAENSARKDMRDWADYQENICYLGQQSLDSQGQGEFRFRLGEALEGDYTLSLGSDADIYVRTFQMTEQEQPVLKGDMDGDGDVDIQDVMAACRVLAPLSSSFCYALPLADREENGYIGGLTAKSMAEDGALLLDVRSAEEFAANALPDAVNIPYTSVLTQAESVIPDKDREIIVYCSTGKRSSQARRALLYLGYTHVYDLGSYEHWNVLPQAVLSDYHEMILPSTPITISLSGGENDPVELRYSVGTDSTAADAVPYTAPFTLDASDTVKAYVFYEGEAVSETSYEYLVFENTLPDLTGLEIQYCSDMEAKSSQIAYGNLGKDVSTDGHTMTIAGQTFSKGISAHAASEVVYDIPEGATRFIAAAGCDDEVGGSSNFIEYSIYIDGVQMDKTVTLDIQRYYVFDIEIPRGAEEIRLVAAQGNSYLHKNTNMHAEWGIAGFVK